VAALRLGRRSLARRDDCALRPRQPVQVALVRSCAVAQRFTRLHGSRRGMWRQRAMESFFALLQRNVLDRQRWSTRAELRLAIVTSSERAVPPVSAMGVVAADDTHTTHIATASRAAEYYRPLLSPHDGLCSKDLDRANSIRQKSCVSPRSAKHFLIHVAAPPFSAISNETPPRSLRIDTCR
jgi:hypothetical protein